MGIAAASWAGRSPALANVPALSVRGGANEYETKFESVKSDVLEKAFKRVSDDCCYALLVVRRCSDLCLIRIVMSSLGRSAKSIDKYFI